MKLVKSRLAISLVIGLIMIVGILLVITGIIDSKSYVQDVQIMVGISLILSAAILKSLSDSFYDMRDATVQHLRLAQEDYNRQIVVREEYEEPAGETIATLDWSKTFGVGWPLQVIQFKISRSRGEYWGKIFLKSLTQEIIDYVEFEMEYKDYLGRKIDSGEKSVIKGLITLAPGEINSSSLFLLPDLISDVSATLIGVRYKSGEVVLMPEEVERYTLPTVKGITGAKDFLKFVSTYLEGRGFDVMPTYYYDSTPTYWNCVFCGTINVQKDNACASCNKERQIQHFAREEFLWKKFEEGKI